MKRSALQRRTPLTARPKARTRSPGEDAWKQPRVGPCAVCGKHGRLIRHHVVYQQTVRREHGDEYDLRNSLDLGAFFVCDCHELHHTGARKIPFRLIPDEAVVFAAELLGVEKAALYLASHYEGER